MLSCKLGLTLTINTLIKNEFIKFNSLFIDLKENK